MPDVSISGFGEFVDGGSIPWCGTQGRRDCLARENN